MLCSRTKTDKLKTKKKQKSKAAVIQHLLLGKSICLQGNDYLFSIRVSLYRVYLFTPPVVIISSMQE